MIRAFLAAWLVALCSASFARAAEQPYSFDPPSLFGRDQLSCPQGKCGIAEIGGLITFGGSTAGYGLGADFNLNVFGFVGRLPIIKAELRSSGFFTAVESSGKPTFEEQFIARLELGMGIGVPGFERRGVTGFLSANALSVGLVRFRGSDLVSYSPNLEAGLVGRHYGFSVAGGWAFFYGDGMFAHWATIMIDPRSPAFDSFSPGASGQGPYGRVDGYFDLRVAPSVTIRAAGRLEELHQPLLDFGSRDILIGGGALLVRFGRFTVGPQITIMSPNKQPQVQRGGSPYVGTLPQTTFMLAFGLSSGDAPAAHK